MHKGDLYVPLCAALFTMANLPLLGFCGTDKVLVINVY